MELRKFGPAGAGGSSSSEEGGSTVVRMCIAVVPKGYERIELKGLGDSIWGVDGYDT
jgi:hypothetical protein